MIDVIKNNHFSEKVRHALRMRAALVCSNPDCGILAVEPSSDDLKATTFGEACHIAAAEKGGARFDPDMTSEQRSSEENGIWLCASCHSKVDKNKLKYTPELLHEWKREHLIWVAAGGSVPDMPSISVKSIEGFTHPSSGLEAVSAGESTLLREHHLVIEAGIRGKISEIELEYQMAEPLYKFWRHRVPMGTEVLFEPRATECVTHGCIEIQGGPISPPRTWRVAIGNLYARGRVELRIRTLPRLEISMPPTDWAPGLAEHMEKAEATSVWLAGHYSWEHRGALRKRKISVLVHFDNKTRGLVSDPPTSEHIGLTQLSQMGIW